VGERHLVAEKAISPLCKRDTPVYLLISFLVLILSALENYREAFSFVFNSLL
jgi:hypothetical protein